MNIKEIVSIKLSILQDRSKSSRCQLVVYAFIASAAILVYFFHVAQYAVNAPWFDDIRNIIEFMILYHDAADVQGKTIVLLRLHNEHRTIFSYGVYLLQYNIAGEINFRHLMIFSAFAPVGLLMLYATQIYRYRYFWPMLAAAALLIFQLHPWHAIFSAMGSLSAYYVLLFSAISLVFFFKEGWTNFFVCWLFAVLALHTNINGVLIVPALLVTQILCLIYRQTQYLKRLFLLMLCLSPVYITFYSYYPLLLNTTFIESVQYQLSQPANFAKNLLFLLGSGYSFGSYTTGIVLGMLLLLLPVLLYGKVFLAHPSLSSIVVFLCGSLLLIALRRGDASPVSVMQSHYYHLSMHLWVILCLLLCLRFLDAAARVLPLLPALLVMLCCLLNISSYVYYTPKAISECLEKKTGLYVSLQKMLDGTLYAPDYWDGLILEAMRRGYITQDPGAGESPVFGLSNANSCYIGAAPYK